MKARILFILAIQLMVSNLSFAEKNVTPLKKGDVVPQNLMLGKIINYKSKKVKFADFKGKLLILDFWFIHCAPCISALPKLEKLQAKFKNELAVIPVTFETAQEVSMCFNKMKLVLPSIVEARKGELYDLFPNRSNPHEIWINENGKVIAITGAEEVNEENVKRYLISKEIHVKEKIEDLTFNEDVPLFVKGNGGDGSNFKYRSLLTDKIEGIGCFEHTERNPNNRNCITGHNQVNTLMIQLYTSVLFMGRKGGIVSPSRTVIETRDSIFQPFNYFNKTGIGSLSLPYFNDTLQYCYSLHIPNSNIKDSIFYRKYVLEDLNRNFNVNGRIEKRMVDCWIIKHDDKNTSLFMKNKDDKPSFLSFNDPKNSVVEKMKNWNFKEFLNWMQTGYYASPLLIDETGLSNQPLELDLNLNYYKDYALIKPLDLIAWQNAFKKYGLTITVAKREAEVLVLTIPDKETLTK